MALCEKARGFKSELARRARGDGSGRDALPDDRLRELLCDTYEDLANEACSVLEKAVAEGAVEERDVDEAVEELDGAAAAAAAAQVDSTEQAKRRKLLEAHRGTTDIHLDPKYEERARKLAAFDFPGKPYAELHLDIKRKLGTEARGERRGTRKGSLISFFKGEMEVMDESVQFSPMDALGCNADTTERLRELVSIKAGESTDLPALPRDDALYKHAHFQALARKFARQFIMAESRAAHCGCPVMMRFRRRPKPSSKSSSSGEAKPDLRKCAVCECVVWEWHVEFSAKFLHLACALFLANSELT